MSLEDKIERMATALESMSSSLRNIEEGVVGTPWNTTQDDVPIRKIMQQREELDVGLNAVIELAKQLHRPIGSESDD